MAFLSQFILHIAYTITKNYLTKLYINGFFTMETTFQKFAVMMNFNSPFTQHSESWMLFKKEKTKGKEQAVLSSNKFWLTFGEFHCLQVTVHADPKSFTNITVWHYLLNCSPSSNDLIRHQLNFVFTSTTLLLHSKKCDHNIFTCLLYTSRCV